MAGETREREDETVTSANTSTSDGSATCAFPGCERPVRDRASDGGGKPPIYCDLANPVTGKLAHTPLTAARERTRQERQGATRPPAALIGETPASAARDRAVTLLDQFRVAAEQMTGTLAAAIEAMTSAGDPDSVSAELTAARRQVDRTQLEAAERVQAAEAARDQAATDAASARQAVVDAAAARDEAINELDTATLALGAVQGELKQARTDHDAKLQQLRAEHSSELERMRTEAAERVAAMQAEAAGRVQAAEAARDQAATDAASARQAVIEATRRADEAREELRQSRTDHREELTTLRREHRDELAAERQRADATIEAMRAEHHRETQALQAALTALRTTQHEQPTPQPQQATRPG
jgi:colicin import membrane protein